MSSLSLAIHAAERDAAACEAAVQVSRTRLTQHAGLNQPLLGDQHRPRSNESTIGGLPEPSIAGTLTGRLAHTAPVLGAYNAGRLYRRLNIDEMPHGGEEWEWLANVSFFVSAAFMIGSLLFISGAAVGTTPIFMADPPFGAWQRETLVEWAYFIGGTYFLVGAYLNWYEVINVGRSGGRVLWAGPNEGPSESGYWGSLLYFVGALLFEVAVVTAVVAPIAGLHGPRVALAFEWVPQAAGGACFTIAACIEIHHNHDATPAHRVWWLCRFYLWGSVLFWLAASAGLVLSFLKFCAVPFRSSLESAEVYSVNLPYLIGSAIFLVGSWVQVRMWKAHQFGLGFIREVNEIFRAFERPIDWRQQVALAVYTATAAVCALNLALKNGWHATLGAWDHHTADSELLYASQLLTDVAGWLAAHGMLLVATVVHRTPSFHPYDYLLVMMRVTAVCLPRVLRSDACATSTWNPNRRSLVRTVRCGRIFMLALWVHVRPARVTLESSIL